MKITLFLVVIYSFCVFGQYSDLVERIVIDDFSLSQSVSVTLSATQTPYDPPIIETSIADAGIGCSSIIGCERDMFISVISGFQERTYFSAIYYNEWDVSTPLGSVVEYSIQYDGRDNSTNLDLNGLNNLDLTDGGLASVIKFSGVVDIPGQILNFVAYSPNGNSCEVDIDINIVYNPIYYGDTLSYMPLANLTGNCDLTNIGAIEINIPATEAIDPVIRNISIISEPSVSTTPSITPTPMPSPSA